MTSSTAVWDILDYISNNILDKDIDVDTLSWIFANRLHYEIKTKLKKYDAIFYLGHGEETRLMGNHLLWSMINKRNISTAKGSIVATMACLSAKELGKSAITKGVRAYIGCTEPYFASFPEKENNFLRDWRDYTTSYFKAIIDGKTTGEAYSIFQQKCRYYLSLYRSKGDYKNYDWYADAVESNLKNTVLLGDTSAKIPIV